MLTKKPILSLHAFGLSFTPRLIPTIATLLALPFLLSLGFWQLHRADFKRGLQLAYDQAMLASPLALKNLPSDVSALSWRRIKLQGHFDNAHVLLLDNKLHEHQPGYHVINPFIMDNGQRILVDRGWIIRGQSRRVFPTLSTIKGETTLTGILKKIPTKAFHLGQEIKGDWPRLTQSLSQESIRAHYPQQEVIDVLLLLDAHQPGSYTASFAPNEFPASKHTGYAVQWFALAITLLLLFFIMNTQRRSKA